MADRVKSKAKTPNSAVIREIIMYASAIADMYDFPVPAVVGIINIESRFDPTSYRYNYDNSLDRSYGLMHLTLPTAVWIAAGQGYHKITNKDLYDPIFNIYLGVTYLVYLRDKYGSVEDAISAYNLGSPKKYKNGQYYNQSYVSAVLQGGGELV